jgi:hypothetical protein
MLILLLSFTLWRNEYLSTDSVCVKLVGYSLAYKFRIVAIFITAHSKITFGIWHVVLCPINASTFKYPVRTVNKFIRYCHQNKRQRNPYVRPNKTRTFSNKYSPTSLQNLKEVSSPLRKFVSSPRSYYWLKEIEQFSVGMSSNGITSISDFIRMVQLIPTTSLL